MIVYFLIHFFLLPKLSAKLEKIKNPKAHMRDPNISWVSMVEKKLGLEMDESDDDESSDDGIGSASIIMTYYDVIFRLLSS